MALASLENTLPLESKQKRMRIPFRSTDGVSESCSMPNASESVNVAAETCALDTNLTRLFSGEMLPLIFSFLEPVCHSGWLYCM